ncbi:MAG: T9SS type A sorting domain-containing protein [Bacteroidota bacterium]
MKSTLLFAIAFLCFSPLCFTQTVWPGDVNNNGIVNEVDLLYLGFAFNATGSPRTDATTDWTGQTITTEWEGTFPDGLNFVYADCNGDGLVNEDDADVIEENISLTHDDVTFVPDEFLPATPEIDPTFSFSDSAITTAPNVREDVLISLGSEDNILEDILGVSFNIKIDPKFFQTNRSRFELDQVTWISPFDEKAIDIIVPNPETGTIKVAITKTDQKPVSGAGLVGTVSFVIIEDIIDLLVQSDTLKIDIDSVTVVKDDLEPIAVGGATLIVDLGGRTVSTYNPILDKIKLYPNPTSGWVLLKTNDINVERVEVVNSLGQVIFQKALQKQAFQSLDLSTVPTGIHWLRVVTEYGVKSTPIQRQ